jgi:hypothetical protein
MKHLEHISSAVIWCVWLENNGADFHNWLCALVQIWKIFFELRANMMPQLQIDTK